jgi:hypothetical protein
MDIVLKEIYDGWKNVIFKNAKIEKLAKDRIKLCVGCDEFTKLKTCKNCGCYMPAKVRSIKSKCNLNK